MNRPTQFTRLWSASLLSLSLATAITLNVSLFQTSSTFAEPFYTPLQILQRTQRNHEIIRLCLYIPRSVVRSSIVCLQGLCRILMSLLTIKHSGMMLDNAAGRSCSALNRIILAAKGGASQCKFCLHGKMLLFPQRRAHDSNVQACYSQRFSRPLPHHPDTRHIKSSRFFET